MLDRAMAEIERELDLRLDAVRRVAVAHVLERFAREASVHHRGEFA